MSTANRGVNIGPPRFKIAVHAIIWLASNGGILSSAMIASQVDSHATFLRRVMQTLTSSGLVESKGGREGGYILRKHHDQITLGEIYTAVNNVAIQSEADVDCGEVGEAGAQMDAELERILQEAEQRTIEYLQKYTITDVMKRVEFFK
ncbi:Rrf2 family transcriptional regulator [Paenibacillus sp. GP183]|jgi:Rrf2 family transcriptional repressor of oqxAB|uniref:RrF2 family transcriptional regulator n=1 Tax=Paenibacillus sp. GP183 TaxID=1882751 RepID=UPI000898094E|nr:Rrf2 family transcriptional regulator [Paenibacillus sp. GP183]SEB99377.1 transcriptional regulator, BadM/Rrf2 family [Paenibacillus sp. GP183]